MAYFRQAPESHSGVGTGAPFMNGFGEPAQAARPAGPVFRFDCGAGCAPIAAAQCRATLRRALVDAIKLAEAAAAKLEANPRDEDTKRHFRFLFGHDPSRPVPWANNAESGANVAVRLRMAVDAMRGRGVMFRCGCPGAGPNTNARTVPPNTILLCPRFWTLTPILRAAVVLHEMLHLLFHEFLRHDAQEHRRNNAHCYEAFVLRATGHTPEAGDITSCRNRPV